MFFWLKPIFTTAELQSIKSAIAKAEAITNAEIKVLVEKKCKDSAIDRASYLFHKNNLHITKQRNCVLIYIATKHKKAAIIGDSGIHKHVGNEFWENALNELIENAKNNNLIIGITQAIDTVGNALSKFYPKTADDIDEISNDMIII